MFVTKILLASQEDFLAICRLTSSSENENPGHSASIVASGLWQTGGVDEPDGPER